MILEKWLLFKTQDGPVPGPVPGPLFTTGQNQFGQLGNNTTINRSSPVQIGSLSWNSVSIGGSHTLAIRSDGALYAWGNNAFGQLGISTASDSISSPVQVGSSSWTSISTNSRTSYAIRNDGALFAWGFSGNGESGNNNNDPLGYNAAWGGFETSAAIRGDGVLVTWGQNIFGAAGKVGNATTTPFQISPGNISWIYVHMGTQSGAAIRSDGRLFTWGRNLNGQLGLGDSEISRSSPVQVGTSSWTAVHMGDDFTAAIRSDGRLFTWGRNINGQLGDGTTISRSSPVQIGTSSWTKISLYSRLGGAIRSDGALFTWGLGSGYLGDGGTLAAPTPNRSSPIQIGTSSWNFLSIGSDAHFAIRSDGALFAWGSSNYGQLGLNDNLDRSSPVQVGTSSWIAVAAATTGGGQAAAIRSDGRLFAWGRNDAYGAVGDNTIINRSSPVQIGTSSWTSITTHPAREGFLAIRSDKRLFGWGRGSRNIGDGSSVNRSSPVQIDSGLFYNSPVQIGTSSWTKVSAGPLHTLAIRSGGNLFGWGYNRNNQIGYGTNDIIDRSSPVQIGTSTWNDVDAGFSHNIGILNNGNMYAWGQSNVATWETTSSATFSWAQISIGGVHAAAIRSDGALFTWGSGNFGAPGRNSAIGSFHPARVGTSSWSVISAGLASTAAIRSDGALFTWGYNDASRAGMLGHGDVINRSSPVQVGTSSWIAVGVGDAHMLAIRSDGGLFSCGNNILGFIGDNTIVSKSSPVQIGTSSWSKLSVAGGHNLVIRNDGALFTWGDGVNGFGRLGLDDNINYSSPVQIGTSSWTEVSAGTTHSLAIRSDGGLFAWGRNNTGQLGDGTFLNKSSPVKIGTSSWSAVAAGFTHSSAIASGNTLFTWGSNSQGELGSNTITNRSSPVQVGTAGTILKVQASRFNSQRLTAAIRTDGALFAWGENDFGQLGTAELSNRSSPSQIAGVAESPILISTSSWSKVSAGFGHNLAIRSDGALFGWGDATSKGNNTDNVSVSIITQIGTNTWSNVYAGVQKSFAVDSNNNLYVWGFGDFGVFGSNATFISSPVFLASSVYAASVVKTTGMHSGYIKLS